MKQIPIHKAVYLYDTDPEDITFQYCDSVLAVLNEEDIQLWLTQFNKIAKKSSTRDNCDFGTRTLVFSIDGVNLVIVSDSGGKATCGDFELFCDERHIPTQSVIDKIDCTGANGPKDIYTGSGQDDIALLTLLHKVFN